MPGMGPPPKPADQRRRRNAVPGTTYLPAEGRSGEPPEWPLGLFLDGEHAAWCRLWATPQAVAWERMGDGVVDTIAWYCRLRCSVVMSTAESVASAQRAGEMRQLADRLGLSPMAMARLRWEIVADELAEARTDVPAAPVRRIRAVEA